MAAVVELVKCRLTLYYSYWQMNEVLEINTFMAQTSKESWTVSYEVSASFCMKTLEYSCWKNEQLLYFSANYTIDYELLITSIIESFYVLSFYTYIFCT